jgi:hypothetical protein
MFEKEQNAGLRPRIPLIDEHGTAAQQITLASPRSTSMMMPRARHFLFGYRLSVVRERSARGPGYVAITLPDGRQRSIRITSTDLAAASTNPVSDVAELPRISARTLIPLMLSANLNLLGEEVIRDGAPSPSRSRCVSTPAGFGKDVRPPGGPPSAPLAEAIGRGASPDRPSDRCADTADASESRPAQRGDGSC